MNLRSSLRSSDMVASLQRMSRVAQDHPVVGPYLEMVTRLPMYARLGADLARDPDVPAAAKASLVAAGVYAISPVDLVPGTLPDSLAIPAEHHLAVLVEFAVP